LFEILYYSCREEIRKRLPVNNIFLHKLKVFQANVSLFDNNRETLFNDVSFIAKTLSGFDKDNLKEGWLMLYSDFTHEQKQDLAKMNFDNMWNKILKRPSLLILSILI